MSPNVKKPRVSINYALLLIGALLLAATGGVSAQAEAPDAPLALPGTGFSYQGELTSGGMPVNAACDFQFSLWDALSGGGQLGSTQTVSGVTVSAGRFTVVLNGSGQFGPRAFDGSARWLEIAVRCPTTVGGFTTLAPRQALTPAPLAFALPGLRTEQNNLSPNVIGGHISNTVSGGVYGVTIGGGGEAGFPNSASANFATVAGGSGNTADYAATVGGGGSNVASDIYATVGGGYGNAASNDNATVGGGLYNNASEHFATVGGGRGNNASAYDATVGGGFDNAASIDNATVAGGWSNAASGFAATVGGGHHNAASGTDAGVGGGSFNSASEFGSTVGGGFSNNASGIYATVGGGSFNIASYESATVAGGSFNTASNLSATVGGGYSNTVSAVYATVAGGHSNTASDFAATVSGGEFNSTGAAWATVAGGYSNDASEVAATVAGGYNNTASGYASFAAGRNARAVHDGAFVWSSDNATPISSTVANQFLVRATGGFSLTTNTAGTTGCSLSGGTWTCTSDRHAKDNFAPVDALAVLQALMDIPIQTWNFDTQDAAIRHMGPMAQDFYAAFGLGETDTGISTVDADGVALAAIQGLYTVVFDKDAEIAALSNTTIAQQAEIAALQLSNVDLAERVTALETGATIQSGSAPSALPWLLLGGLGLLNVGAAAGYLLARRGGAR